MMKRINVYLDDDLWYAFRKRCLEARCSASKTLATLLSEFLLETPPVSPPTPPNPVARSRAKQAAKAGTSA